MATGVGESVEAAEVLYLRCGPRYSRQKMGCLRLSWSISEKIMVEGDECARCFLCLSFLHSKFKLPIQKVETFELFDPLE
jgi:hypothetical protein